jgi:hypothetical protein
LRCRLHGGLSTGPKTLEGITRLRAARTKHGRYSAADLTLARWKRRYITGGYRSARAMRDPKARAFFLRLAGEPIPPNLLENQRLQAVADVLAKDLARLQAKGFI